MVGSHVFALDGRAPEVHPEAYLAPTAVVLGEVTIGAGSSVWFHAIIRADTDPITLGRDVNVQDGCVLHADPGFPLVLEDGVSLGHAAIVHGAHVGEGSLIGMGAVVLNGARIGRSCLVAGGAVVRPGTEVPDGSLVAGVPAKVRRPLTEEERSSLASTAEKYGARIGRYRAGLRAVAGVGGDHAGRSAGTDGSVRA
jgi:carbonic anhydrase/acetyltransferase-like protein (isoleucine patch superfamily)